MDGSRSCHNNMRRSIRRSLSNTHIAIEVTSKKDQEQYWADRSKPYRYVSVTEFANRFKKFHVGVQLANELSLPFEKSKCHKAALVFSRYSVTKLELFKACWDKEVLLIKRNSFFYIFKTTQIIIVSFFASTVYVRTRKHHRNEDDAFVYNGALSFTLMTNAFNGYPEITLMIARLPVFFKQRDLLLYPAWSFAIPLLVTKLPMTIFETIAWMAMTYYTIGFAPEAGRFFKQMLVVFLIQQMAASLFRLISGVCRTIVVSNTGGMLALMFVVMLAGFTPPRTQIPKWWKWGYWVSPVSYTYSSLVINEMYAPRWMNRLASDNITRLGVAVLEALEVYRNKNWYWVCVGALVGYVILFNVLFTLALTYLNPPAAPQAVLAEDLGDETRSNREMEILGTESQSNSNQGKAMKGMVLPFTPLSMSFDKVNYYVDMPSEMKAQGVPENRLQLLREITGRTVVCTIHQPSIDIFEAFDELLLMKRGGQVIYFGRLGRNSQRIIEYFETIPGIPKIKEKQNPATWMLEVSSVAVEAQLGIDFAEHYKSSSLYQQNKALVHELTLIVGSIFWGFGTRMKDATELTPLKEPYFIEKERPECTLHYLMHLHR
ncbi:hypothetical protein V6N13_089030 [Hibiscus sabdariffa]